MRHWFDDVPPLLMVLGHWNKENERKNENKDLVVDHFSLTFVNLLLA